MDFDPSNIELANGKSAAMRGAETVRRKQINDARRATDAVIGVEAKDIVFSDRMITDLLDSWTLDLPLPTPGDMAPLEQVSPADYRKLFDAATEIHRQAREGIVVEPDVDPKSPTSPLGG